MDVKTAFLRGRIDDDAYIEPPEGLRICSQTEVLKLNKGLYGLKQSPCLWNEKWKEVMKLVRFSSLQSDECIFVNGTTWLLIYVDDILIITNDMAEMSRVKSLLQKSLDVVDMGELHYFLGVSFRRFHDLTILSQEQYINKILSRFGMYNCKPVATPICTSKAEAKQPDHKNAPDRNGYREIMRCLLFLATRTRPDISVAVPLLCRGSLEPDNRHFVAAKRILRYLQGTKKFGLRIGAAEGGPALQAYADADWAND